ncbi:MAG: hypothetical protein IPG75_17225 [Gemmatimonadetes bacterium]|nr:hypothetical protein [Gemmatimonadota bacterium]
MIAMVTPGGTQNDAVVTVRRHQPALLARFLCSARGTPPTAPTIGMTWQRLPAGPVVTVTNDARRNRGLIEWEVEDSLALQNPGDSACATVTHCTTGGVCTEERRIVKLANDSKPILLGSPAFPRAASLLASGRRSARGSP